MKTTESNFVKIKVLYGLLYLAAIVLLITGCGKQSEKQPIDVEKELMERIKVSTGADGASTQMEEDVLSNNMSILQADVQEKFMQCEPNREEKEVFVEGALPHFSLGCAADTDTLFLSQRAKWGEAAVYAMDMETDVISKLSLEIPADMDTNLLAVDPYGNLYVHLNTVYEQRTEGQPIKNVILCLDEDYNVVREVDFTDSAAGRGGSPHHFLVDAEGNFYVQWGWHSVKGLLLDKEGKTLHAISDESLGVDSVQAVGLNASGGFSVICAMDDDKLYVGDLDTGTGCLREMQELSFVTAGELCLAMGPGTDTDRLLFSDGSGIWAYNEVGGSAENRSTFTEGQEGYNIVVLQRMFLPDGRLCLLETVTEKDELAGFRLKYIAGGN